MPSPIATSTGFLLMADAIAAGFALAFVVVVWAMSPSIGDEKRNRKDAPLDRNGTRKGGCM